LGRRISGRRITTLLRRAGWTVNAKRVERIRRREGLKVSQRQPRRGRLWLNDGSWVQLRPQRPGDVWSYDFVADRADDGRAFRMLTIVDAFSRAHLAIAVARKPTADDVPAPETLGSSWSPPGSAPPAAHHGAG